MSTKIVFVLGYKLPWILEAVMAIYNYAPGDSLKMDKKTNNVVQQSVLMSAL